MLEMQNTHYDKLIDSGHAIVVTNLGKKFGSFTCKLSSKEGNDLKYENI